MAKRAVTSATPRARKAAAPLPSQPKLPHPAGPAPQSVGMQFHTPEGARKYLASAERGAFLAAAERADRDVHTLCMTLAHSGCRLSEALALTVDRYTGIRREVPQSGTDMRPCRQHIPIVLRSK